MLEENLASCTTLPEVQMQTQATLSELRDDGFAIHHVAGPISCDGDKLIRQNLVRLLAVRTEVMQRSARGIMVLTAPLVFTADTYDRLGLFRLPKFKRETALGCFWDDLILSGLIEAVHLAKGWERSPGSQRERSTALGASVPIYEL